MSNGLPKVDAARMLLEQMQNIGQPLVSKSTSEITSPGQGLDLSSLIMLLLFSKMFKTPQTPGDLTLNPQIGSLFKDVVGPGAGSFSNMTPGGFSNQFNLAG